MKKFLIFALFLTGCSSDGTVPVAQDNSAKNANIAGNTRSGETMIAHSTDTDAEALKKASPVTKSESPTKYTRSGDPLDTAKYDKAIADGEAAVKKSGDDASKKALSKAYYNRGEALTQSRQYASALGDFRRAVKNDPSNAEAQNWINEIEGIYKSMNRESPKEGEEPAPIRIGEKSN
ncbi:MAG: tetratricopeptide repeat protein [Pyrinomonadaceae bacterium]